jgi:hypothetical protein
MEKEKIFGERVSQNMESLLDSRLISLNGEIRKS